MLKQILPQLAAEPKSKGKLDTKFIEAKMADPNWLAEEKFDGSRYLAHFEADGVHFTSRRTSVKTGLQVEKGANLPHINMPVALIGTVLDGEITLGRTSSDVTSIMGALPAEALKRQITGGWARYRVWDILYLNGVDMRMKPLRERKVILAAAVQAWKDAEISRLDAARTQATLLQDPMTPSTWDLSMEGLKLLRSGCIELVEFTIGNKEQLLAEVQARGGEGLVLKNLDAPYKEDARDKNSWIKLKGHLDFDVVIMGFTQPDATSVNVKGETVPNRFFVNKWISAVVFGQYKDGALVELGQASGLTDDMRKFATLNQTMLIGKVMTVVAQEQIPESGALRHPRIVEPFPREDKDPKDCKWNPTV